MDVGLHKRAHLHTHVRITELLPCGRMQCSYFQQEVIQCDIEGCADARSLLLERIGFSLPLPRRPMRPELLLLPRPLRFATQG